MQRRKFFRSLAIGGAGAVLSPVIKAAPAPLVSQDRVKPATNIADAMAIPRNANSMPGKYPGKVVKADSPDCIVDGKPSEKAAYEMVKSCMLNLTGETDLKKAWLQFVGPEDVIGIKVNPIGGKLLSTSHAITQSIVKQLEEAGISRSKLIIWDRREEGLDDADFTEANYPGIQFMSTECYDENKSYINSEGRFYSEDWIEKEQFFYAEVEEDYDAYTLPYMVNSGKYSYFTKICTEKVTKIINVPILKNAGTSITVCMKNLAYGSITNTGRLHKDLWHETCAYVCAFPPLRDKVVLNIVDGILGCFDGGPAANPQFICQYKTVLAGTDPVAVDRICYDIVLAKRIAEGVQAEEKLAGRRFMELAEELQLGVADRSKIDLTELKV
ncbi:hypothetical protein M2459_001522 [Parabacteroides sp. PF5-5]|uniref:DUF362 domain-containing protein n=1 Tax=unclassified Parabacteroides TaxID=2649774 RepID=UPI0024743ACA|nr:MULTISPECIES: DUF362 domain-containing protein [unclassified Parabacteroides]MDH6304785.1 hypothetical protein [Parabacteroides sp. PH5-39]MDH6315600.1 hypothetical protein [Parabacteroides sp. PF5-13]MDH6319261.1 hypothetical protein [Parabacteroides sp. PH5-13]MDH6322992.1 hypothetical protein [Parabacteroides sp. PH5-8]MDH6326793.1 hypothetical protein [Parabacteroides sp. PH5-41]